MAVGIGAVTGDWCEAADLAKVRTRLYLLDLVGTDCVRVTHCVYDDPYIWNYCD